MKPSGDVIYGMHHQITGHLLGKQFQKGGGCFGCPPNGIYLVYNIWLQVVYVGLSTEALASRLCKPMTDSSTDVDYATQHKPMAKNNRSGWGILPLQWVEDDWHASVEVRHSWWIFRRWACNDIPPGISTNGEGSKFRGWMNQRVLAAL